MTKIYFTEENQFLMSEEIGSILTEQKKDAGTIPCLRCLRPDIKSVAKTFSEILIKREDIFEITYRIFEKIAINNNLIEKKPYYNYELSMMVGDVLDNILK